MATRIITINEVIEHFNQFVNKHAFLRDFGYGPTSNIGTSRQMKFPYLWITHRAPSNIQVSNRQQVPELLLTFLMVDQVNDQENVLNSTDSSSDNQQEILSDTFQYCQDLITYIITEMRASGIQLNDDTITVEPVYEETQDKVTGWMMDIRFDMMHINCDIPIKS